MGKGKCILPPSTMSEHVPGEKYVRMNSKRYQDWLIPQSAVCGILTVGLLNLLVGIILLAIGSFLTPWGAVLLVIGIICLTVCVFLCLHAYCIFSFRDQETQTNGSILVTKDPDFIPTYAVIDKKPPYSPTKSTPDGSLIKNGKYGGGSPAGTFPKKQVTIAPDVERPTNERVIPIQYQSPQPTSVTYGQPNRTYPSQGYPYQATTQQPASPPYGYPLHPRQPTPYSSLTHKSPAQSNIPPPRYPYRAGMGEEDYDNTHETAPMIVQHQNQSNQSWRPSSTSRDDEPPEPQPLVYPSEKRPMTFEQVSSSKMSIYDNMYALDKIDD